MMAEFIFLADLSVHTDKVLLKHAFFCWLSVWRIDYYPLSCQAKLD